MGLLDGMIGQLLGGAAPQGGAQTNLLSSLLQTVQSQPGGLGGLVQQFNSAGLGNVVQSWIGTGQNMPISPQQIQQALGDPRIQQLAQSAGISPQEVSSHLSTMLPQLVDKLTPNGQLPSGDLMQHLQGLLGGLGNLGNLGTPAK
jgi:uncharacterized protein YidB (DUF937 family)